MSVFLVTYDLKRPGQNYEPLYEELKNSPNWWHYLDSTWLLATWESVTKLTERVRRHLDANDSLLVIQVINNKDGWLPKEAWDWINSQLARAA